MAKLLTNFQKKALKEMGKTELAKPFIWSGGTALSYYYLQHRESFDLDFMSIDLLPDEFILNKEKISLNTVFDWAKKKFGVIIDPVIFGSKVLEGADKLSEIKPLFRIKYDLKEIKVFLKNRLKNI